MKMQQLRWIFGLTGLATLAIVGLQAYIWRQGIQQGKERFRTSVHHAVEEAVEEFMRPLESHIMMTDREGSDTFAFRSPGFLAIQIGKIDSSFQFVTTRADSLNEAMAVVDFNMTRAWVKDFEEGDKMGRIRLRSDTLTDQIFIHHKELCTSCKTGYSQLSSENFKPLLEKELAHLEIDADFYWGVQHLDNWLIVDGDTSLLKDAGMQIPIFTFPVGSAEHSIEMTAAASQTSALSQANPFSEFSPPVISLYFQGANWHLLRSIGPTLLSSTLLGFLVLGCIGYALFVIMRQKQLSEIKTDFINNMTHELKTPISTISLACEALQDSELDIPPASQKEYLNMIGTESERLAAQVEKVLQMALLDKKDLGLKFEPVNVHYLLNEIVEAFSLQLQQREGMISTRLDAQNAMIEGDVMHLRQMFTNLLDNANKYSPDSPEISIETKSNEAGIEVAVHDKGLGISRDALRKVFDRFYRVPTGNLHDVKGFGLGLSYVQTMALAHGGHVRVTSKPGVGSSFYLFLPYDHG